MQTVVMQDEQAGACEGHRTLPLSTMRSASVSPSLTSRSAGLCTSAHTYLPRHTPRVSLVLHVSRHKMLGCGITRWSLAYLRHSAWAAFAPLALASSYSFRHCKTIDESVLGSNAIVYVS